MRIPSISIIVVSLGAFVAGLVPAANASSEGRITNGTKVSESQFAERWGSIVSIQESTEFEKWLTPKQRAKLGARDRHVCGGTLIAPTVVVTAAHCVQGESFFREFRFVESKLRVLVGTRSLAKKSKDQKGTYVDVVDIRVHPNWKGESFWEENAPSSDVAVLRLKDPVTAPVMPLVGAGDTNLWGSGGGLRDGAMVAGWGVSNPLYDWVDDDIMDSVQGALRQVAVPILSDRTCERSDLALGRDAEFFDRETMLCAHRPDTLPKRMKSDRGGTCYGDSGGPLSVPDGAGSWKLAGIVSWGPEAGGGCNGPSVFTRIDGVRDWIQQVAAEPVSSQVIPAPRSGSAKRTGIDTYTLRWARRANVEDVARYRVFRDVAYADMFSQACCFPKNLLRRLRAVRVLVPIGVTGPEATALRIRDVAPGSRGAASRFWIRIEATSRDGRANLGPRIMLRRAVDLIRPRRVGAPIFLGGKRAPVVRWAKAFDNDCVARYLVQARPVAGGAWRSRYPLDTQCSSGFGEAAAPFPDSGYRSSNASRRFPLYEFAAGQYAVRIVAIDRAGNRTIGPERVVRVPKRVRDPQIPRGCQRTSEHGYECRYRNSISSVSWG